MNNWLNPDNKFFSIMGKAFDMLVVNMLWLAFCVLLPMGSILLVVQTDVYALLVLTVLTVIPIVPATTAMYYTVVKVIRRERSYALKEFFRSFKRNFKLGTGYSLLLAAAVFVMYIDFRYAWLLTQQGESAGSTYLGIFLIIALLISAVFTFLCPVLSRFDMKFGAILKTAFFMSTRHILTTLVLIVLMAAVLLGSYVILPGMFFLPVVGTLLASFLIERVFKKYMPAKTERTEEGTVADAEDREDTKDEWYLE